jgi:FlaA1/EpsC-like NDP-sugar epimerase
MEPLEGKRVLITGGTGSLGQVLVRRLLSGELGRPAKIIVFSRDEAKQHAMRVEYLHRRAVTDEVIYRNFQQLLEFRIGDVRDFHSIASALRDADAVFNAAALKQVPTCEYFPFQAVGQYALSEYAVHLRALWQRAGLARVGDPALSRADQGRWAGDDHHAGDDPLSPQPG